MTDVQLKYTEDGKFRRFAFIGFKTEEQAKLAQSYFDQTFVDTCKISVEECASLGIVYNWVYSVSNLVAINKLTLINASGDPSKPRSWSKYANDSSHKAKNVESNKANVESKENLGLAGKDDAKSKSDKKKEKKKSTEVNEALKKVQ